MNQLQNKSFEEALVRYREKWDKIKDPCVVYDFPIPDVSCKELFLKRVSEHPNKTYVISHGAKMSYVECNTLAAKIANGFLAKGLKKGDRVITYVSNGFEFVALAHACFKTGIIMVNTNPRSTADEIIRRIKDCTPKMVITDSDGADAGEGKSLGGTQRMGKHHLRRCHRTRYRHRTRGYCNIAIHWWHYGRAQGLLPDKPCICCQGNGSGAVFQTLP